MSSRVSFLVEESRVCRGGSFRISTCCCIQLALCGSDDAFDFACRLYGDKQRRHPPVQTIYSVRQALEEYFAEGEEAKWARHTRVFEAIHKGIAELGFNDIIKRELQAGLVVSVKYPDDANWDFEKVHDYCYERGFTIYPGKVSTTDTFRLCALGAIDEEDIVEFFKVFREALEANKIAIPAVYKN